MPPAFSRRDFLRIAMLGSGSLLAACASLQITSTPRPTDQLTPTSPPTPKPTLTPAPTSTLALAATPSPSELIKHIVVFIQENHTFDSLFASFPGADGQPAVQACLDALSADPPHQHRDALTPNGTTTKAANCSYTEASAPNYWRLAREFTLCDRFFSDVRGPQWNSTALFLVWDDWGGFYDHVEPPTVETLPDGTPLRYGFRVPCIMLSPYARSGYVSHQLHSFVSLLRFVETIFDLGPLTPRDAQASDMLDCFDFARLPHLPIELTPRICPPPTPPVRKRREQGEG